ncbi:helix-turn-helix transcriptional regulator [Gemmatimonas sp.]|uniref:helix-turn-helix transcriptional regulator n=1 Tax=Gemmatimonas sp. TaxID=1962908 RepID=UPI003DA2423D
MHTLEASAPTHEDLLSPAEVSAMLSVSIHVLAKLRRSRRGPRFYKMSHRTIRYRRADVQAWLSAHASANPSDAPSP